MNFADLHDKYVLTVPLITALQIGQSWSAGAQDAQDTRWPHGRKTTLASDTMQILHNLCSFNSMFSFSRSTEKEGTAGLTHALLHYDISVFENRVDSDQLASDEAS